MMSYEEFQSKMKALLPACTKVELAGWHEFAQENVVYGQIVDYASEPTNAIEEQAAVAAWLESLYAGIALVKHQSGEKIAQQMCSLGTMQACLYPYEMNKASQFLRAGGDINEVGDKAAEGEFYSDTSPRFPKRADVAHINTEHLKIAPAADKPRFIVCSYQPGELVLVDREARKLFFYYSTIHGQVLNLKHPKCWTIHRQWITALIQHTHSIPDGSTLKMLDICVYTQIMSPEERARCKKLPEMYGDIFVMAQTDNYHEALRAVCALTYDNALENAEWHEKRAAKEGAAPPPIMNVAKVADFKERAAALQYCEDYIRTNPKPPTSLSLLQKQERSM